MEQLGMHVRRSTDESVKSKEKVIMGMNAIGLTFDDQTVLPLSLRIS
jgi:hypothetical protein